MSSKDKLASCECFCNCTFISHQILMLHSCSDEKLDDVRDLVKEGHDPTKVYDHDGKSLLHLAAE